MDFHFERALEHANARLFAVGLIASMFAQVVFGIQRFLAESADGRLTGWQVNLVGGAALGLLYAYLRQRESPRRRRYSIHVGLAVCAVCLVIPIRYGMDSSPWWLGIMPLAASLLGGNRAGAAWAVISAILIAGCHVLGESLRVPNAAGESLVESTGSRVILIGLLFMIAYRARVVSEEQTLALKGAHAVLLDANRELLRANSAKTTFLANVSHEIRTPISGVIGMTQLALDGPLPNQAREYVQTAHQCAGSLLGVINDILDVSRAESGELPVESVPFSLEQALVESLGLFAMRAESKGISFTAHVCGDMVSERLGDSLRVRQIVTNLVGNALKFTSEGRVDVLVFGDPSDPAKVSIAVSDSGIGIDAADLIRIFEPFAQADERVSRRAAGTGLGLTISRDLARRLGGDIEVVSELGRGSTFTAHLRLPPLRTSSVHRAISALPVLLLGDDSTFNSSFVALASTLGYRGYGFATSDELAAEAETTRDSPVLIDARLPVEIVVDAVQRLRAGGHRGTLWRVGFTGIGAAVSWSDAGFDGSVALPVFPETFAKFFEHPPKLKATGSFITAIRDVPNEASKTEPGTLSNASSAVPTPVTERPREEAPSSGCVLLIEDNPVNRLLITRVIERAGFRVDLAVDGIDGLERLDSNGRYDCVITDIQMPRMDGLELTSVIRSRGWTVPIIALSAHAMQGDGERFRAAGVDAYLPKPVNPSVLLETIGALRHGAA
ncbi:MAG: response regulator [Myxococcales bacterium]|nr:response regulator [Myxococcales bacterium]